MCRSRHQGRGLLYGRLPRRDHGLVDQEHQLLQQPAPRLRELYDRLPAARHWFLRACARAPAARRVAQGPPQPPAVQHRLLRAQAARGDHERRHPAQAQQAAPPHGRQSFRARHQSPDTRTQIALALAVLVALAGCANSTPAASNPTYPATGLVLLSLTDGTKRAAVSIGTDPVAVVVSNDGTTAYLADSSPGHVYAVTLPDLKVAWKQHVGGAPFGLLLHSGRLFVSLFSGALVVELDPNSGTQLAT